MESVDKIKVKVKERQNIQKGMKFIKGSNYVVNSGTVVAACKKKSISVLGAIHTRALDTKGTTYDAWKADKIKKTWKVWSTSQ